MKNSALPPLKSPDALPLTILGIDPGLADVGWGVIQVPERGALRVVDYGVLQTRAGVPLPERLRQIFAGVEALIQQHRPAALVIEELFFAKNAKTAMVVAHGRAAAILAAGTQRVEVFEYTPPQLKQALTGKGSASKLQVQLMVKAVLRLEAIPQPDHAADALAAALCHAHSQGLRVKLAAAGGTASIGAVGPVRSLDARHKGAVPNDAADPARAQRKALLAQTRSTRRRSR
jgi:crossover junction endodeoxyribonuclease RuvC